MNKSVLLALAIVVALGIWMTSGPSESAQTDKNSSAIILPAPMKVSVLKSDIATAHKYVVVQGQVEARRSMEVKVEIEGRVSELFVKKGERVKAGDSLAALAADYRFKALAQAKAVLRQKNSNLSASKKLKKRGLIAESLLIADQAGVEIARAQLAVSQHAVDSANIYSPFDGVLNSRLVEVGDFLQKGNIIGTLVDDSVLKITGQVAQKHIAALTLNERVEITLNNGFSTFGQLQFISRIADPNTRSYLVEVTLDNPEFKRLIGVTASLKIPLGTEAGHLLPNAVLGLGTDGNLQVKLINDQSEVRSVAIQIIRTDAQGFWIKGLPDHIQVIAQGKDFVNDGEIVEAIYQNTDRVTMAKESAADVLVVKE